MPEFKIERVECFSHRVEIQGNNVSNFIKLLKLKSEIKDINSCPDRSEKVQGILNKALCREFMFFVQPFISGFGLKIASNTNFSGKKDECRVYLRENKFEVFCEGVKLLGERQNVLDGYYPIFIFDLNEDNSFYVECCLKKEGDYFLNLVPGIIKHLYNINWKNKKIGLHDFDFKVMSRGNLEIERYNFAPINLLPDFFEAHRNFCEMMGEVGLNLIYKIVATREEIKKIILGSELKDDLKLIKNFELGLEGIIFEIIKNFNSR